MEFDWRISNETGKSWSKRLFMATWESMNAYTMAGVLYFSIAVVVALWSTSLLLRGISKSKSRKSRTEVQSNVTSSQSDEVFVHQSRKKRRYLATASFPYTSVSTGLALQQGDLLAIVDDPSFSRTKPDDIADGWVYARHEKLPHEEGWIPATVIDELELKETANFNDTDMDESDEHAMDEDEREAVHLRKAELRALFTYTHEPKAYPPCMMIRKELEWLVLELNNDDQETDVRSWIEATTKCNDNVAYICQTKQRRLVIHGGVIAHQEAMNEEDSLAQLVSLVVWSGVMFKSKRRILVLDGPSSPLPYCISGWVTFETCALILRRIHLYYGIDVLISNQPFKATVTALHYLHTCCDVYIAAQARIEIDLPKVAKIVCSASSNALDSMVDSIMASCGSVQIVTAFTCAHYPSFAIQLKCFLGLLNAAVPFIDRSNLERVSSRLFRCRLEHRTSRYIDRFIDLLQFCDITASELPLKEMKRMHEVLLQLFLRMVKSQRLQRTFSGLNIYMPIEVGQRMVQAPPPCTMSTISSYMQQLESFVEYYDCLSMLFVELQKELGPQHLSAIQRQFNDESEKETLAPYYRVRPSELQQEIRRHYEDLSRTILDNIESVY